MIAPSNALETERSLGSGVYAPRDLTLVRADGATVEDDRGRVYLDAMAGYGVLSLGHRHPEVVAAIREQSERMLICPGVFANDVRAAYLEELVAVLPGDANRVFFCNSGTESVEAALKFARLDTGRAGVVSTHRSFHGRTMGALSANGTPAHRAAFEPLVPGFRQVPYNDLGALDAALTNEVGALLLEVVQGEGGVRVGTEQFLRGAQALCRERGVRLVLDEVQTGFGRTGRLFACQHFELEPDFLCLGKAIAGGVPMGACAISSRVRDLPVGSHGSTFGGNPLACAAARASLRVMLGERLWERAAELGGWMIDEIRRIDAPIVREVRGLGLMIGVELKQRSLPYIRALQDAGVLALPAGGTVIRLLPPIVTPRIQLERIVETLEQVLIERSGLNRAQEACPS